ncbi:hypothetical protein [Planococcus koreensis]|uniref:hypothetical protein n=1 Tax=Planococcus koreensis TaxID=112331 RepID=UPI0039FDAB30
MEKQLQFAPLAYLVFDRGLKVLEMNEAMRNMLSNKSPKHFHEMLTIASMVYFQTYFLPAITLHGKVNEMFLTIKGAAGSVPVLMNAVEREGRFECAMIEMTIRGEYEENCFKRSKTQNKSIVRQRQLTKNCSIFLVK